MMQAWKHSRKLGESLTFVNEEHGRIAVGRSERIHYALGILGVESDFENLDLDNDEVT